MLFSILGSTNSWKEALGLILLTVPCILIALIVHEVGHGLMALWCGDKTAKNLGRLTLNPVSHLDPFGTILMLLVGIGWTKPVPVNSRNFKHPRLDFVLTALAGPIANLLTALLAILGFCAIKRYDPNYIGLVLENFNGVAAYALQMLAVLNIGLALFNLIPLPPLDGSNVIMALLPEKARNKYSMVRFYLPWIFLGLVALRYLGRFFPTLAVLEDYIWMPLLKAESWVLDRLLAIGNWLFFTILG